MFDILKYQKPWPYQGINWGHPLSKNLRNCWVLNGYPNNTMYDLVSGEDLAITDATKKGYGLHFDGTSSKTELDIVDWAGPFSIVLKIRLSATAQSDYSGIFVTGNGALQTNHQIDTLGLNVNWSIGASSNIPFYVKDKSWHTIVATFDSSNVAKTYDNGKYVDTLNHTHAMTSTLYRFGVNRGNNLYSEYDLEFAYIYDQALYANEIRDLSPAPYQIFERGAEPEFFSIAAAGPTPVPPLAVHQFRQRRV